MADRSKIEWTDATPNPIYAEDREWGARGWHCTHVSEGCRNCYAEAMNRWRGNGHPYRPEELRRVSLRLDEPLLRRVARWKKPRRAFWGSMTDLFGDWVPDLTLDMIFAAISCHGPGFLDQILTKRPERMFEYLFDPCRQARTQSAAAALGIAPRGGRWPEWPLPHLAIGVSIENQATADERIPLLLRTPAAVRFVSYEPALGPVDLSAFLPGWQCDACKEFCGGYETSPRHAPGSQCRAGDEIASYTGTFAPRDGIRWVIAGGESGRNARPSHPDWFRSVRDQCQAAGVPFFFKQWGEWAPHRPLAGGDLGGDVRSGVVTVVHPTGESDVEVFERTHGRNTIPGTTYMKRGGKERMGRLLDGREWNEFPGQTQAIDPCRNCGHDRARHFGSDPECRWKDCPCEGYEAQA